MRKIIYSHMVSLDGFIEVDGPNKPSGWAVSDEELIRHFNDLEKNIDAHLYGRRVYEHLAAGWPNMDKNPSAPEYVAEYARLWKNKPKIVFSRTLQHVEWNSRLVKENAAQEMAKLKAEPGKDLLLFGANLAATAIPLGLIDEYRIYVNPVLLGGGKPLFPQMDTILRLRLLKSQPFGCGVVLLRYSPEDEAP